MGQFVGPRLSCKETSRYWCFAVLWHGMVFRAYGMGYGVVVCRVAGGHAVVCDVAGSLVVACPGSVCHVVLRCGASLWGAMMYVF